MVIVCPECTTKFRVNPERIPDSGAKVRCARCKHIFIASKPVVQDEPTAVSAETTPSSDYQPEQPAVVERARAEETGLPREPLHESFSATGADDNSFSYDQFRDLDATKSDDDDFTFGAREEAPKAPADTAAPVTEPDDEQTFSFSAPADEPAGTEPANGSTAGAAITKSPETKISAADEAIARALETTEEPTADTEVPPPAPAEQSKGSTTSLSRILLLLLLGLLIIGGALYYINGPEQIEQMIQQILGQQASESGQSGRIALTNLEGKFVNNQEVGELFVIRGEATNNYHEARSDIQVKGVIFDQNGKPLLQKTIFCGNPINDQELQTLPFNKLEEIMGNQFGKSLNNMKVNSKEAIPFTIAFRDLPKNLSEFSVNVTSSKPATE